MEAQMKQEVLAVLKHSYDNLIENGVQKCFLYCALLPNYAEREHLIMMLAENGLLNEKENLEEMFDEGYAILDKPTAHSLLFDDIYLRMHDLVRNMAYHILKGSHKYMLKYDKAVTKIPHMQEWTRDLEVVTLMFNKIGEIPDGTSPFCPHMSTLILHYNRISHIPNCFFRYMNALAILDLSENEGLTSLPNSLSNLRSLVSLVLRGCSRLKYIPPLGELQALSRLDISDCSILQVPKDLENLINLKWLDLSKNFDLLVPGYVLSKLTNMQGLDLRCCSGIKVIDVQGMSMLECFGGSFLDQENYNGYMQEIQHRGYGPKTYLILMGKCEGWMPEYYMDPIYLEFKLQRVWFGDCEELPHLLPRDLEALFVTHNDQWECLCATLSWNGPPSLMNIDISDCKKLKSLLCLSKPGVYNCFELLFDEGDICSA